MRRATLEPIAFTCAGSTLVGMLHRPVLRTRTGVVAVTGGPQYRIGSHRHYLQLARALADHGYPTLRFDQRGAGDSEGEFRGFQEQAADLQAAIDVLQRECPWVDRIVLFGLCDAAAAILLDGVRDPRVSGLILANPWVHTERGQARSYVQEYYGRRLLQGSFWRKLFTGGVDISSAIVDFLRKLWRASQPAAPVAGDFVARMLDGLRSFRGAVMILLSERDLTAGEFRDLCARSVEWRRAISSMRVGLRELPGVDHTFSSEAARQQVARLCVEWLTLHAADAPGQGVAA